MVEIQRNGDSRRKRNTVEGGERGVGVGGSAMNELHMWGQKAVITESTDSCLN